MDAQGMFYAGGDQFVITQTNFTRDTFGIDFVLMRNGTKVISASRSLKVRTSTISAKY